MKVFKSTTFWFYVSITIGLFFTLLFFKDNLKSSHKDILKKSLKTVHEATLSSLKSWEEGEKVSIQSWSINKEIISIAKKLTHKGHRVSANRKLNQIFSTILDTPNYRNFYILSTNGKVLASSNTPLLSKGHVLKLNAHVMNSVFKGKPQISLFNLDKNNLLSAFLLIELSETKKVLALELNLEKSFSNIFQQGRIGDSGESYAIDLEGLMISNSRFVSDLVSLGLLSENDMTTVGKIKISDPGILLKATTERLSQQKINTFPFTKITNSLTNGKDFINLQGYRDYRGVPVIGIGSLYTSLSIGVITEIDYSEAYETLYSSYFSLNIFFGLLVSILWISFYFTIRTREKDIKHKKILEDLTTNLEIKVNERTLEYKKASKAKSLFLAKMSHEIRTPIASIINTAEQILFETKENLTQKNVKVILKSSDILLVLINDILNLTKIESNSIELMSENIELNKVLDETAQSVSTLNTKEDLQFHLNIQPSCFCSIIGDPVRLSQIVTNLLNNSFKFTDFGEVSLFAKVENNTLHIEVSDTGVGINKHDRLNIFSPFEQAENSSNRKFQGSGLGLSIVKNLVELMSGKIDIQSKEGLGTTFFVSIPVQIEKRNAQLLSDSFEIKPEEVSALNCLIVEDNLINHKLLNSNLKKVGFTSENIFSAYNGQEAIDMSSQKKFDIIFMDCMMPIIDGYSATKTIREKSNVYIIAITANAFQEDIDKCFSVGMNDFLGKPYKHIHLKEKIHYFLQLSKDKIKSAS